MFSPVIAEFTQLRLILQIWIVNFCGVLALHLICGSIPWSLLQLYYSQENGVAPEGYTFGAEQSIN